MDVDRYDEVAERELVEVPRARHIINYSNCMIYW